MTVTNKEEITVSNYWELTKPLSNAANHEMISEFLLSLKLANRSQGTIYQYRYFLDKFFSEREEPFHSLSSETIREWFVKHEGESKEATIKFRLSILSSFYHFCVTEEHMEQSPIKSRWFPRLAKPVPKYLGKEEVAITRHQSESSTLRDQVLLEFMLTSGCRVAEVSGLNREDVDIENRTARVTGKGKKIRHVHFTDKCALLMEQYLDTTQNQSQAIFISEKGERLGTRRIQQILQEMGEDAGLSVRLHPHRLRHTFATDLLSKGADLGFIGDELGHSDISTTQIYARLPQNEIVSMYRKFMG